MLETIFSIKFCLFLVFLIGLLTGFFYIRRLIKEDYLPIIKKYKKSIDENNNLIKEYENQIKKDNDEISYLRNEIKRYKNESSIVENDLLNTEHNYVKQTDKNNNLKNEIQNNEKILQSLKNEAEFLTKKIEEKDKLEPKNSILKKEIEAINHDIVVLSENINAIKYELDTYNKTYQNLETEKENLKIKIKQTQAELDKLNNNIKNDKKLSMIVELNKLDKQLKEYKSKMDRLKNGK